MVVPEMPTSVFHTTLWYETIRREIHSQVQQSPMEQSFSINVPLKWKGGVLWNQTQYNLKPDIIPVYVFNSKEVLQILLEESVKFLFFGIYHTRDI